MANQHGRPDDAKAPWGSEGAGANDDRNPEDVFSDEFRRGVDGLPQANILITGQTGVGKSTLINAIFRRPLARTGVGRPVTDRVLEFSHPDLPVRLYDTPGIELGNEAKAVRKDFKRLIKERMKDGASDHIHLLWYCVQSESARIQDFEVEFITALADDVPVIVVFTQVPSPSDQKAEQLAASVAELNLPAKGPICTLAQRRDLGGHVIEPFGLDKLARTTYELLPEGVRRAFSNAQGVEIEMKAKEARKQVFSLAVPSASAIGAAPIPLPDAGPLLVLQIGMLARITAIMGVDLDGETQRYLIKKFVTAGGIGAIGKAAASFFRKFIPGATVINATVAGALTLALGEAYIQLCSEVIRRTQRGEPLPDIDWMVDFLLSEFKRYYTPGRDAGVA